MRLYSIQHFTVFTVLLCTTAYRCRANEWQTARFI